MVDYVECDFYDDDKDDSQPDSSETVLEGEPVAGVFGKQLILIILGVSRATVGWFAEISSREQ